MTTQQPAHRPDDTAPATARGRAAAPPRLLATLALVAVVAVAGCGSGPGGQAAVSATPPAPTATPPPAGSTPGNTPGTAAGVLLWPVTDVTQAKALQAQVDQGSQAWLLDPSEVATDYATTVLGWRAPSAGAPDGGTVVVTDPDAGAVTLTLVQPATTGSAGVWVVSAERRN
ncbi:acyl transferase [Pseudonocardia sp. N23]|uniref:acyl transferase n=1 Tax=Pseudonocardia sp. N23 TaxID=1987376 RepID=UPI000BFE6714|nr:acyl transferase [Pseudonocardia sp. N23]GAY11231.1 hypothetical protein TOK_5738 [Pseudonocardia sp. N23]